MGYAVLVVLLGIALAWGGYQSILRRAAIRAASEAAVVRALRRELQAEGSGDAMTPELRRGIAVLVLYSPIRSLLAMLLTLSDEDAGALWDECLARAQTAPRNMMPPEHVAAIERITRESSAQVAEKSG